MDQEVRRACVWRQVTGVSGLGGHRKRQVSATSGPGGHRKRQVSGVRVDERVDAGRDRSVVSMGQVDALVDTGRGVVCG